MILEQFYMAFVVIQILHSIEELCTGFHEKFPPMRMTFRFFFSFELIFNAFWVSVLLIPEFPFRIFLMASFCVLMFANGLWHIVWFWFFEKGKRYVPGLVTAPLHVAAFLVFYAQLLR